MAAERVKTGAWTRGARNTASYLFSSLLGRFPRSLRALFPRLERHEKRLRVREAAVHVGKADREGVPLALAQVAELHAPAAGRDDVPIGVEDHDRDAGLVGQVAVVVHARDRLRARGLEQL